MRNESLAIRSSIRRLLPLLGLIVALPASLAATARAEEHRIELRPRFQTGDRYLLSLSTGTRTAAVSGSSSNRSFQQELRHEYHASVTILETDGAGRATRERHDGAQLLVVRKGESGQVLPPGTSLEVRREADGDLEVRIGDRRPEKPLRGMLSEILATQLEYSQAASLLDPGRPVRLGESWALDPKRTRRLLRSHGVKVLRTSVPATARLVQEPLPGTAGDAEPGGLAIDYDIPVDWCELVEMPANARAGHTELRVQGRIRLWNQPVLHPATHTSNLALRLDGSIVTALAAPSPWHLSHAQLTDQQILPLRDPVAADF